MNDQPTTAIQSNSSAAAGRRKRWRRFAWLVLLAQSTLFWQGCDGQQYLLSLGVSGPWITVGYDNSLASTKLFDVSIALLVVNVLVVAGGVLLLARLAQPWFERCTSRLLLVAAAIVTLIYNSILYFGLIWMYLVGLPINWLAETFFSAFLGHPGLVIGSLSRVYYAGGVLLIAGVLRLIQALSRRYLFIHDDRWQVSLGGLLVLMALLGTGIGMLLRLFAS